MEIKGIIKMKVLRKRNFIIIGLIILLFGVCFVDWMPQPIKVVNHYLLSVQKKDAQEAYQILYIQNKDSRLDFETFKETVTNEPLIKYKINGSSKINKEAYYVSVHINKDGEEIDHEFYVRKIEGKWKIVF